MPPKQNQPPIQRPLPPPKLAPLPTPTSIITPKIMLSDPQPNNLFKPLTADQNKSISSKNASSIDDLPLPLFLKYPQLIYIIPASLLILLIMKK